MRITTQCILLHNNRDGLIVNTEQNFELTTSVKTRFLLNLYEINLFIYLFTC